MVKNIHEAIESGDIDSVKKFFNEKTKESVDIQGRTPLFLAVEYSDLEAVKFLLSQKAKPDNRHISGFPCIFMAAKKGDPEIMEALLEEGADYNVPSNNDRDIYCYISNPEIRHIIDAYEDSMESMNSMYKRLVDDSKDCQDSQDSIGIDEINDRIADNENLIERDSVIQRKRRKN